MKAGVISVQGAAPEHVLALRKALSNLKLEGEAVSVRKPSDLEDVSCLIIPGGESTTISKLLHKFGIFDKIVRMAREGVPIMGTCAGCVLLAKEGDEKVAKTGTELLGLMDMAVERNAFGRQRESFETQLSIKGLEGPFPGVFIRAPIITRIWGGCEVLSEYEGRIVMARQDNLLAISFHPELSKDVRIHELLLKMI